MAYYQGDYYSGSYYQGAFPFIGAAIAKIGAKVLPKLIGGGAKLIRGLRGKGGQVAAGAITTRLVLPPKQAKLRMMGLGGGYRRMNVTNVKALRRAGRRVRGFLKLASRLGALPVSRGKSKKLFQRRRRA